MGGICKSNQSITQGDAKPNASRSTNVTNNHDPNLCFIFGNQFCGKSTFQKRIQMLENGCNHNNHADIDVLGHLTHDDIILCRLQTIATILQILKNIISESEKYGITTVDHDTCIDKDTDDHDNINEKDISPYVKINKFLSTFDPQSIFEIVFNANNHFNQQQVGFRRKGILPWIRKNRDLFDTVVQFLEDDEFTTILNNCESRLTISGGSMLIKLMCLLQDNHLRCLLFDKERYMDRDKYDSSCEWQMSEMDYLCSHNPIAERSIHVKLNNNDSDNDNDINDDCTLSNISQYKFINIDPVRNCETMTKLRHKINLIIVMFDLSCIDIIPKNKTYDDKESLYNLEYILRATRRWSKHRSDYSEKLRNDKDSSNMIMIKTPADERKLKDDHDDQFTVPILVLLNKYDVLDNYIKNNVNCDKNTFCDHIVNWKPATTTYEKGSDIIDKYENNPKMKYFRKMLKENLNCDDVVDLIKYKMKFAFEYYQRDVSQFDQNVFICNLLSCCQENNCNYNVKDDVDAMKLPLITRKLTNQMRCEKVLCFWIQQEGMENVLIKDLINVILKYCKWFNAITPVGEIFARVQELCKESQLL